MRIKRVIACLDVGDGEVMQEVGFPRASGKSERFRLDAPSTKKGEPLNARQTDHCMSDVGDGDASVMSVRECVVRVLRFW